MKRILLVTLLIAAILPASLTAQEGPGAKVFDWLRDNMGMEMGSVSIDGTSYSKVVLSPDVKLGKMKLGFYLPIIYTKDLFDPNSWYAPGGNNEWSFGTEYWGNDTWLALKDTAEDLILKIKYLEYGQPLDDPFFVKVGNLKNLTMGHGLILRNYRNDSDFPSIRRTGINTGIDFGGFGFEALANDLPFPEIFGARLYFRPIKSSKLAFGFSGVADIAAAKDLEGTSYDAAADNFVFVGSGIDLDLPVIEKNAILGIRAFADASVTVPYIQDSFVSPYDPTKTVSSGLQTDLIWDGGPRNWGAATGFMGNLLFIDWRLEYRYFTGIFRPAFFDSTYERSRSTYVQNYIPYIDGSKSSSDAPTVMGIYGEAGFTLFRDKLMLQAGYMWPWNPEDGFKLSATADDEFHAGLGIKKGLIPVVDLAGAIYYDKWGLVNSIASDSFEFFDEKTAFAGEIEIPIPGTPNLAIGLIFKAVAKRDPTTGNVVYKTIGDPSSGVVMTPSITMETRFRF
ncbi:MAG: hypothetical protein CVV53_06590 [Spirochaetae bacterium HGW-Spirochaetae-9]|nr:MAG: hypothetical protein CVV53_06590 [Spirochaetae bacterium HGW-Spirochaetae-9]